MSTKNTGSGTAPTSEVRPSRPSVTTATGQIAGPAHNRPRLTRGSLAVRGTLDMSAKSGENPAQGLLCRPRRGLPVYSHPVHIAACTRRPAQMSQWRTGYRAIHSHRVGPPSSTISEIEIESNHNRGTKPMLPFTKARISDFTAARTTRMAPEKEIQS